MTVPASPRRSPIYTGNGVTIAFAFAFKVFAAADLNVRVTSVAGVITTAVLNSDYTVTLNPDQTVTPGGSINFLVAPATGVKVVILGALPYDQPLSLPGGGNFNPVALGNELDRQVMQIQQIADGLAGAITVPIGESVPSLPAAAVRAGYQLGFDSSGNPIAVIPTSGAVGTLATDLADSATPSKNSGQIGFNYALAYGANTIGKWLKDLALSAGAGFMGFSQTTVYAPTSSIGFAIAKQRRWNPCAAPWFCKFDGSTDDTTAIIQCLTDIYNAGGGVMVCPPGICRISSLAFNYAASVSVSIEGAGGHATYFQKLGASGTPVIALSAPAGVLDVYSHYADFSILGNASVTGLQMTNMANFTLESIESRTSNIGLDLAGSLVGTINRFSALSNVTGIRTRKAGGVYCNTLRFNDSNVRANSSLGWDIGDANDFLVVGGNSETNGTAANTATGAVSILATVDDETGASLHQWQGHHFENNLGRNFQVAAAGGLILEMDTCTLLGSESGRALNVAAISKVVLNKVVAAGGADVVTLAAASSDIRDSNIATITDSSGFRNIERTTTTAGFTNKASSAEGTATMVAGTIAVAYASLRAGDLVFITHQQDGGAVGFHRVVNKTAGVGFTVNSSNAGDTSTFAWKVERAA